LCVYLIAGDTYVAVDSQRFTRGEIDNFDVCVRVVVGDAQSILTSHLVHRFTTKATDSRTHVKKFDCLLDSDKPVEQ
jgi:hypothetical protein